MGAGNSKLHKNKESCANCAAKSRGDTHNIHNLSPEDLKRREVR